LVARGLMDLMQLPLKLINPPQPALEDGVTGRNQAALTALEQLCHHGSAGDSLYLWGPPGCGKSFWLKAWERSLADQGILIHTQDGGVRSGAGPLIQSLLDQADQQPLPRVWLLDNVDLANSETAAALFRLYNAAREHGLRLACTASAPPLRLQVRDDLRTRLGQSLIYELLELDDEEKRTALRERATRLGWTLSDELLGYLMTRLPRDLGLLTRVLDSLDQLALSRHRSPTIPLLKELLDSLDAADAI
jgi:DnaA-homolog protein